MERIDRLVLTFYIVAMTILLVVGKCEYDVPVYLVGSIVVFIAAALMFLRSHRSKEDD